MKILCIGRNYADHIKELGNERPDAPIIFMKPDTALLRNNDPFYLPDFSDDVHHEVELVVKINKQGKSIDPAFAHKYYNEIGLGIDFTARDLQAKAKEKGHPWELAKGFNGSAPISNFIDKGPFDIKNLNFSLKKNGVEVQNGNTSLMLWPINEIIAYVSTFFTLKVGDLIFTGTPEGVGKVDIGDRLVGLIEETEMFNFKVN